MTFDPANEFSHVHHNPHYRRIQRLELRGNYIDPNMRAHAETWQDGFSEAMRLMTEREEHIKDQICCWLQAAEEAGL